MPLNVGSRLGHYDVTALIGEGGMGQVYQATDTKLKRQVALKILPDAFSADPERLARFQREAEVLASLNHPNIAQIHGLEEADGVRALVLELVEGPTLADRIKRGPIPLDEALPIAKQIAEALEAAHEQGVIHRDLKPANVKVKDDGTVKVLDFGLAKALDPNPTGDPSQSPTLTAAATQMGVIMGTAAYMSPEQASGQTADKRSDIWSFGVVLYEMLTGQRLFTGETVSHVLAKVLERDIDFSVLPTPTPTPIKRLLRRCLEKDRKRRVRDIGDALADLDEALTAQPTDETAGPGTQPAGWRQVLPWAFGTLVLGGVLAGVGVWAMLQPTPQSMRRLTIALPQATQLSIDSTIAISPDDQTIVFVACEGGGGLCRAYRRPLDGLEATAIPGTENPQDVFFSPDGLWLGIASWLGGVRKVPLGGGSPVTVSEVTETYGASWSADDTIVYGTQGAGLLRISADGGEPTPLTTVTTADEQHSWPQVLPGGEAVIFQVYHVNKGLETSQIAVVSLDTGEQRTLVDGGVFPRFSATGHIVFGRGTSLWAVPFDPNRLEVTGSPVPVADDVQVNSEYGVAAYAITADGSLVYASGKAAEQLQTRTLVWVDREGREEPLDLESAAYDVPRISPDGTRVAVDIRNQGNADVWIGDVARGTRSRLTTTPTLDGIPLWTPDGERVVFSTQREGQMALYWKAADGTGTAEHLATFESSLGVLRAHGWSADGRQLIFEIQPAETGQDIGMLSIDGDGEWQPLLHSDALEFQPAVSPDGAWLAYVSNETGQPEVYVQSFPGLGNKRQITSGGGEQPLWSPVSIPRQSRGL